MQTMKSLLFAAGGIVSLQRRLEGCTVDGGPGTVLKYTHTHTHTHSVYRQDVPGGMDKTSGECSLC